MLAVSGVLAAPMAFATKTFADFDDAMRMVKAVSGATEGEFKRLTEAAEKLGRETSYTAKEVAEGMTAMGRMGLKPDEILSAVPAVLNRLCANAVNITPCTIVGTLYDTGWGFPAFEQTGDTVVHAELIEIPFEDWPNVDRLEGYPRLYDRKLIQATLADGSTDTGWVYIMNSLPATAKVIQSGDWKKEGARK